MARAPDPKKLREDAAREKAQAKARAFNDYELKIHVGDEVDVFRAGAVTPRHVLLLRQATRTDLIDPVMALILGVGENAAPVDYVGQLVYLARLQAGERVALDEVLDGFTLGNEVWVEFPERSPDPGVEGPVFADPPTRGAGSEG